MLSLTKTMHRKGEGMQLRIGQWSATFSLPLLVCWASLRWLPPSGTSPITWTKFFPFYNETALQPHRAINEINAEEYLRNKGYQCNYLIAKEWTVSNQAQELLSFYRSRAYGLCGLVPDEAFHLAIDEFELFCHDYYGPLEVELSSQARFEIWTYTAS
jgi:hypothetical protein